MGPERSRARRLPWLALLALLCLAADAGAQGKRKGNAGRSGGRNGSYDGSTRTRPAQESTWSVPREKGEKGEKGENLPPIYLPGFDAPKKGPHSKKSGAAGEKVKANEKKTPPKPADPMKEADQVTAAADHLTEVEKARAQALQEHFLVCDLDASGWLSLRECEVTLSLERAEFKRMDKNQDGRLDPAEFAAQGDVLLARLGAEPALAAKAKTAEPPSAPPTEAEPAAEPVKEPEPAPPASPDTPDARPVPASELETMPLRPAGLLERYDADESAGLDPSEVEVLFRDCGLVLSSELVVAQMDRDDSGELEAGELVALAWLSSQHLPEALRAAPAPSPTEPPVEPEPAAAPTTAAAPARAPALPGGPLSNHFRHLDPGHDGFVDESDLRALQSPSRLDLRLRALLSAMDQDGDGRLSEAEFRAAMGANPR